MKNNKIKPPIGTANTGYEYQVEIKPPFGEALVIELRKILEKSRIMKKSQNGNAGEDVNSSNESTIA